ncbi:MAG: ABC-F family ATP-binding cassette domain-containing protein [Beijerinckiaceae bacterium]|nr:ABC-F family ATP-binding cassette domain-containing protein [Beijerinckiaceae bacterium]MCZ8299871.1 ABC-F family ATP-binding cassette domain-containing protein [Beijerinckiaceae bacterium]
MLTLSELTYRLGPRLLIDSASVTLPDGARCGLVGRNGCGKSTLFRLLLGEIAPESGTFSLPRGARMGHVAQEAPGGPVSLLDYVLAADTERASLLSESETATDPARIADIQIRLTDIGAHAAPARAAAILSGLGFSHEDQARPCSDFSGGWRMRVSLAAMLFLEPDLLLLDEPTNYLDIEGAIWLKSHLRRYPHTLLVVSHDKEFLDSVCDAILHLDRGKMTFYRGNYSLFARQRAEKAMLAEKEADKVAAQRAHLQAFIDRFKAKASKAKQAQSRVKQLEKLGPVAVFAREEAASLHLRNPEKPLSPPIVTMDRAVVGYGERVVLRNLTLSIAEDDRIGLLGQNGNGKSTLVKLIAGRLAPLQGEVRRAPKLDVAYFAQHQLDELDASETPYALVRRKMPSQSGEAQIRARAAQLGFGVDKADTPIARLSGGEKARLLLGLAAFDGPHLLILDEPTNHLDIPMREALVEALAEYRGAVIIVSHDRAILDASCDRLWLVAEGVVKTFDGDLDDYEAMIIAARGNQNGEGLADREASGQAEQRRQAAEKRQNIKPLREKSRVLEAQMEKLQTLLARADDVLAAPDTFAKSPERAVQIARDRAALAERLAAIEEEWLEVMAEIEAVG